VKKKAFLASFAQTASVTKAAEAVEINRAMHYRWLRDDPKYAAAFERAKEQAAQGLEDEAVRRAYEGTLVPVFWKGKPAGVTRSYSDGLLQFLLKGFRPEKYRERSNLEVSGPAGSPVEIKSNEQLKNLSDDELSALIAITSKLAAQ
jgi:hypothetical protein